MMAAIRAAELGKEVTLLEKKPSPANKMLLSGKGRCNLTNACDLNSFLERFPSNGQFLRDAFKKFFNQELMKFFEDRGLKLKVERQLRVFPVTDRSSNILEVLKKELYKFHVELVTKVAVKDLILEDKAVKGVFLENGAQLYADKVILATGGVSYAFTGSTGDGIEIARRHGHRVVPLRPGLVPLVAKEDFVKRLEGLSLENIRLNFSEGKKEILSEVGDLLFTASGISGPLVVTLSGKIADWLAAGKKVCVEIDLKPGLTKEQLDARFLREFKSTPKRTLKNVIREVLPIRLIDVFIELLKISPEKTVSHITQEERQSMVFMLKGFRLEIVGTRPIEEAMVTRGGVSVKDVNPRTMESRLVKGLYFAGEIIDVDADTGGFNLQAAFSTGYLAGESAATD